MDGAVDGLYFSRLNSNFLTCLMGSFRVDDASDEGFNLKTDHDESPFVACVLVV